MTDDYTGLKRWPLTYGQLLLWFLGLNWPEADLANRFTATMTETLTGPVDPERIRAVAAELTDRHEPLRSAFVLDDDGVHQIVLPQADPVFERTDLTGLATDEREAAAGALLAELAAEPISLFQAPAVRWHLVSVAPDQHHLFVGAHHLFFDHWSRGILRDELIRLLEEDKLEPLEIQYVDYAVWRQELADGGALDADIAYWGRRLADMPALRLPTDHPRPADSTGRASQASVLIPADGIRRLREVAGAERVTPYTVLLTIFLSQLARLSGQPEVGIPMVFSGRLRPETQRMVGMFEDALFIRHRYDPARTVREAIAVVHQELLDAYQHHDAPLLAVLQEQPHLAGLLADEDAMWAVFNQEIAPGALAVDDLLADTGTSEDSAPAHEEQHEPTYSFGAHLDFALRPTASGLYLRALYRAELWDPPTIDRWVREYAAALDTALRSLDLTCGQVWGG
jgi:hypothetical protein